jgi:hypothetical protein
LLSYQTDKSAKTLNAIAPIQPQEADDRTARHLRLCAELTDLAMQLARAAAARTLTNWAQPEPPSAPEPSSIPAADPQSHPETAPHRNRAPTPHRAATSYKPTDPAVLFTRFAAVVRDCISLEVRLTAGANTTPRAATLQLRADPRRAPLREAFRDAIKNHPDRADLQRETTTRLDEQLTNDPDQTIDLGRLFFTICDELGIEPDLAQLPDKFLTWACEPTNAPDPRATSPP